MGRNDGHIIRRLRAAGKSLALNRWCLIRVASFRSHLGLILIRATACVTICERNFRRYLWWLNWLWRCVGFILKHALKCWWRSAAFATSRLQFTDIGAQHILKSG